MAGASTVLPRILEPETLDHLAPDDPVARRSRRDLRRVNAFMGARGILARALDRVARGARRKPLRIVELGCGDGRLMLEVARHRGERWPEATINLLDRQPIVDAATIAAYAAAGWRARPVVADVLDWAAAADGERWTVVANLFCIISKAPRSVACSPAALAAPMPWPRASRGAAASPSARAT
jgi:hypothetical protein